MTTLIPLARKLRREPTAAERLLWSGLRRKAVEGFRFRRQVPLQGFIVDFACFEPRLVVEVDRTTADADVAGAKARDEILRADHFVVLRVKDVDVLGDLDEVLRTIRRKLLERRPRVEGREAPAP